MRKFLACAAITAGAVLTLAATGLAASAIHGPDEVVKGQDVKITVSTTSEGLVGEVQTKGLKINSVSGILSNAGEVVLVPEYGTADATYECTVTGEEGTDVAFHVVNAFEAVGEDDRQVSVGGWSASVGRSGEKQTPEPTERPIITEAPLETVTPSAAKTAEVTTKPSEGRAETPGASESENAESTEERPANAPAAGVTEDEPTQSVKPSSEISAEGILGQETASESAAPENGTEQTKPPAKGEAAGEESDKGGEYLPKTGDSSTDWALLFASGIACAGLAVLAVVKMRQRRYASKH